MTKIDKLNSLPEGTIITANVKGEYVILVKTKVMFSDAIAWRNQYNCKYLQDKDIPAKFEVKYVPNEGERKKTMRYGMNVCCSADMSDNEVKDFVDKCTFEEDSERFIFLDNVFTKREDGELFVNVNFFNEDCFCVFTWNNIDGNVYRVAVKPAFLEAAA